MTTLIRPTYPVKVNVVILTFVFFVATFFSYEMFDVHFNIHNPHHFRNARPGMMLMGVSAVLMVLIMWEEILFHVKVKQINGGLIFRNHKRKLLTQILLFIPIPAIFVFVDLDYDLKESHLMIWAAVCILLPAFDIIFSGIKNRKNFLKLTSRMIKYKNSSKEGSYDTKDIVAITLITEKRFIQKMQLSFGNNAQVVIDLDEMHLHEFYDSIYEFVHKYYAHLIVESPSGQIALV